MPSCCVSPRPDRDDAHHPGMHVIKHMAVEGPVADRVGGDVKTHFAARRDVDRMLARRIFAMPGNQLEKMSVKMDRMRHHRVVHQRHTHPFVFQEWRSEEHTSELQSLMRISYAV